MIRPEACAHQRLATHLAAHIAPAGLIGPAGRLGRSRAHPAIRDAGDAGETRDAGDAGAASVLVLALASVLALIACVLVALAVAGTSRHRAAVAADLGALAAAGRALQGPAAACAIADQVVRAQGGQLTGCRVDGEISEIEVSVRPGGTVGMLGAARGRARAGPAGALRPPGR